MAILVTLTLGNCSVLSKTIEHEIPDRPKLRTIIVQNCRMDNGVKWCEVNIANLLLNDAEQKAHIKRLEAYFRQ